MTDTITQFDLDDPVLPKAIKRATLSAGGYPYDEKLDDDAYAAELVELQKQLVLMQADFGKTGRRAILVFEGRDAAGKGGAIKAYTENLNPRTNVVAALPKPSDREATQWYFQRYVDWLPAAGETVLFDRSWYNRAGVEPVMGFCTPEQTERFLAEAPRFEEAMVDDGVHFFKFWLDIGRETQLKRFHDRRHDPLKTWKLNAIDIKGMGLWDEYSAARDRMLAATDSAFAPWTVVLANDKNRARLAVIKTVLSGIDFEGRSDRISVPPDPQIAMSAKDFLARHDKP